ncbi:alkaline phosphatase [Keratinibaculum paraultunense]|uniref:Alkaline phosphatase n=1 Tax=Keratinibaculum paraultunense TaxID=1278232 RepID=A0A4R3KSM2_9FIRM|nr:alkaline phosphatase [Keratinibaculum paraultunense]QQY79554.1 alkaline phosphatase [Keratinibaculum paraultunense]TCS87579.1 alkaline phosphatase [Keratinibaculum paraultunense]
MFILKNSKFKKIYSLILSFILVLSIFLQTNIYAIAENMDKDSQKPVKNIILLIGDGMGESHITLGRILKGSELYMDSMPYNGTVSTHPLPQEEKWVTDSAAAGTALATGVKTYNGYISVDKNKKPLETILEKSQKNGKSVGLVTTTRITHATPAVFASHNADRDAENEIAEEMIEHKVNVLLGGGKRHFIPKTKGGKREDNKNLIEKAKQYGYKYVETVDDLNKINKGKILGLFNLTHMNYEIDRDKSKEPSLSEMTAKAIEILNNEKNGFFLMVEGGRIDHASHANDPATTALDVIAFDDAVKTALDFAKKDKNTLVIVTADHETGGLAIGGYGVYNFKPEELKKQKISLENLFPTLNEKNFEKEIEQKLGIKLNPEESKEIKNSISKKSIESLVNIVNLNSNTGWASSAHTATDVPIKAYGPGAERFSIHMDNTDVNKIMLEMFGWSDKNIKKAS